MHNRDGMILTDKEDILKQWTLHFSTLLNRTSEVTIEALESIQQRPMIPELDAPPNTAEVDAAIKQLQTGKAPEPDGIPAEVFKAGGENLIIHLTSMFQVFWVNFQLPRDLRDANIIYLYKNKGDRSSCDNHRGISLLSLLSFLADLGLKVNFGHFKQVFLVTISVELKPKVMYHLIKETFCFYNVQ